MNREKFIETALESKENLKRAGEMIQKMKPEELSSLVVAFEAATLHDQMTIESLEDQLEELE